MLQYIFTNQSFDFKQIGVNTSKTKILSREHTYNAGMYSQRLHEADLTYEMTNDQISATMPNKRVRFC